MVLVLCVSNMATAGIQCSSSSSSNVITKTSTIPPTTSHFIDNYDGTISDPKMELTWKKCSEGQIWDSENNNCLNAPENYTWNDALQHAQLVNINQEGEGFGYSDWRIPNIKELSSIIEAQCYGLHGLAINTLYFPNTKSFLYWSSSPYSDFVSSGFSVSHGAWGVSFILGEVSNWPIGVDGNIRLVRN